MTLFATPPMIDYHTAILAAMLPAGPVGKVNAAAVAKHLDLTVEDIFAALEWMTQRGWVAYIWSPATAVLICRRLRPSQEPSWSFQSPRHIEQRGVRRATNSAAGHPREHALKIRSKDSQPPICASPSPDTQSTAPLGLGLLILDNRAGV